MPVYVNVNQLQLFTVKCVHMPQLDHNGLKGNLTDEMVCPDQYIRYQQLTVHMQGLLRSISSFLAYLNHGPSLVVVPKSTLQN